MTDLEYRVLRMLKAVETGDVNELELLADEVGVTPIRMKSEYGEAHEAMRESVIASLGVPSHLLQGEAYVTQKVADEPWRGKRPS